MKYQKITALPFYCLPAILEMILRAEGIQSFTQEIIGEIAGITFPKSFVGRVPKTAIYSDDCRLWGMEFPSFQVIRKFKEDHFSFEQKYYPIAEMEDYIFEELVSRRLSDSHLIIGYEYLKLNPNANTKEMTIGHVSLVTSINDLETTPKIQIYDPGPKNPGIKEFPSIKIFSAIHARNSGVWVIRRSFS